MITIKMKLLAPSVLIMKLGITTKMRQCRNYKTDWLTRRRRKKGNNDSCSGTIVHFFCGSH